MTPLPHELVLYTPWLETCSFTSVAENRTEWRWTVRCIDRSADVLAGFEMIAATVGERVSQPESGEAMEVAIAEDAASGEINDTPVEAAPNDDIYRLVIDVVAADAALDEIAHQRALKSGCRPVFAWAPRAIIVCQTSSSTAT